MTTCAVEADLNRYLAKLDADDAFEDLVEERTEELLEPGGEYHPFTADNISETMGELTKMELDRIAQFLSEPGNFNKAGAVLAAASETYWAKQARKKAENDVEESWSSCRCHGRGCRRCEEPDE